MHDCQWLKTAPHIRLSVKPLYGYGNNFLRTHPFGCTPDPVTQHILQCCSCAMSHTLYHEQFITPTTCDRKTFSFGFTYETLRFSVRERGAFHMGKHLSSVTGSLPDIRYDRSSTRFRQSAGLIQPPALRQFTAFKEYQ